MLLLALGVFLSCGEAERPAPTGPRPPLQWLCASRPPAEDAADEKLAASPERGGAETSQNRDALSLDTVARLLGQGRYERALRALASRSATEQEAPRVRYLKAWALTQRAQATCSIPDALLALVELEEPATDGEGEALRSALRRLLGFPGPEAPWPDRFEATMLETSQAFVAGEIDEAKVGKVLGQSRWYSRQVAERNLIVAFAQHRAEAGYPREKLAREEAFLRRVAADLGDRDRMLSVTLEILAKAGPDSAAELAEAFRAYAAGTAAYEAQQLNTAEKTLAPAIAVFDRHGIPLAEWARLYSAIRLSYESAPRARALFDRLAADAEKKGYRAVAGRAWWLAATSLVVGNEFDSGVQRYRRAQELLAAAGERDGAAFVEVLLAEAESRRGNELAAWRHRRRAFAEVPGRESLRRRLSMYWEAATALENQGLERAAGPLHRLSVEQARQWGQPLGVSVSLHGEAIWLLGQGRPAESLKLLDEAEGWIASMEESPLKEERRRSQKSYLGRVLAELDPPRGEVLLRQAVAEHRQAGRTVELLDDSQYFGAVLLRLGRREEALAAWRDGLADFETAHATAQEGKTRAEMLAQARRVGDLLVAEHFRKGEPRRALEVAEGLKRHRYEGHPDRQPSKPMAAADWLEARDSAWLSSYVTREATFWWLLRGKTLVRFHETPTARLEELVARLRSLERRQARASFFEEPLAELDDRIARPLGLHQLKDLTFLPDLGTLHLPLPGLFDRERGRFLIEDTRLRVAAGARGSAPERSGRGEISALLVGVAGGDPDGGLDRLPAAEAEVAALAAGLGKGARVFSGEDVPRSELVEALGKRPSLFHFAGHAVQNSLLPWESFLWLGKGSRLTLGQLRRLDLSSLELAVLSSCSSVDGMGERRDAAFGLAGALIAAGARSVLASSAQVADDRQLRLMRPFYREYLENGADAPLAFQRTATQLIADPSVETSPADWMFWSVLERLEAGSPDRRKAQPRP